MSTVYSIVLRSIAAYLIILIVVKLMGKREVSQMTYSDYIVGITIGTITGVMAVDSSVPWWYILPGILVFGILQIITASLSLKSTRFRESVSGDATILIDGGKIIERNLKKERITASALMAKLREKNAFNLADVEYAMLETDGELSVMLKPDKRPVTPSDLKLTAQSTGLPVTIILEGTIIKENLVGAGLTSSFITSKLASQNINDISKVFMAQIDNAGNLYVDVYDEKL